MDQLVYAFQEPWALRALAASLMVGLMCGVLGSFIVLRNMSLIGDALSHAILPGIVLALIIAGQNQFSFFIGSVVAGLLCAVTITWIQRKVGTKNDAAIGIVYVLMFSLGVIGISSISRREGVHLDLKDFLFGDALGVSNEDLILTGIIMTTVILCVIIFYRQLLITTFQASIAQAMGISVMTVHYFLMLLLSFAVVASLRTVGVILVVSMLITPSASALLLSNNLKKVIVLSGIIGMLSAFIGLTGSILINTPSGPAMAVASTLFYAGAVVFAPNKGIISKQIIKNQLNRKILQEDILKHSIGKNENITSLVIKLNKKRRRISKELQILKYDGMLNLKDEDIQLSEKGQSKAESLVRAHRLWETYLVDKIGLKEGQIHKEAENIEHHLSEELLDKLDFALGFPIQDPHGSPIPRKIKIRSFLADLTIDMKASFSDQQPDPQITDLLWSKGVSPKQNFIVQKKDMQEIHLLFDDGMSLHLPNVLAQNVAIITHS